MSIFDKIKSITEKAPLAVAIGKMVLGGKGARVLERIEPATVAANETVRVLEAAIEAIKRKPK